MFHAGQDPAARRAPRGESATPDQAVRSIENAMRPSMKYVRE